MTPTLIRFVGTVLMVAFIFNTTAYACGPFALEAIFVHTVHPGYPLERFAWGELGVVQPTYARSYLYVAYRYLMGSNFSAAEQKTLTEFWQDRLEYRWPMVKFLEHHLRVALHNNNFAISQTYSYY